MEQLIRDDSDDELIAWLIDRLAEHIAGGAEKADFLVDREVLPDIVEEASVKYFNIRFSETLPNILHELEAPLACVIAMLKQNRFPGVKRHLDNLDDLARAIPPKRGRGRPSATGDLRAMVECLVGHWEKQTGRPFTQYWKNGEPKNAATKFVHAVVAVIAHDRLGELPEVTEKIVADRRKATSVN